MGTRKRFCETNLVGSYFQIDGLRSVQKAAREGVKRIV